ncbi:MAG: hypothetical protein J6I73_06535 [Treponema sp.]|nr:hypothetical protein [Treponema sp.]
MQHTVDESHLIKAATCRGSACQSRTSRMLAGTVMAWCQPYTFGGTHGCVVMTELPKSSMIAACL